MDRYAQSAADHADAMRAALAFVRMIRERRHDDAKVILGGTNPYVLLYHVAEIACHQDLTDDYFEIMVGNIGRAETDGTFARIAREIDEESALEESPPPEHAHVFIADMIGTTPAGTGVGTAVNCETCKRHELCCQGEGTCIIIRHLTPGEAIVQHITAEEARKLLILLLIAAGKAG